LSSGVEPTRIWDAASGRGVAVLRGHDHQVGVGIFSSDGRHVVTYSSGDGTARLWNASSGRQLAALRTDRIEQVAFTSDASRVIVLSEDGTVRLFSAFPDTRSLVAHALKVVPRHLSAEDRKRYFLEADSAVAR
jgi:WD40 repeat protein